MLFESIPCCLGCRRGGANGLADPLRRSTQIHTFSQTDRFIEVIDGVPEISPSRITMREFKLRSDRMEQQQKHPLSTGLFLDREFDQRHNQLRPDDQFRFSPFGKLIGSDSRLKIHTTYWNSMI